MHRKIFKFPDNVLRQTAKAISKITPQIEKLIDDMLETMYAAPGIGLAAPQVGKSLRVIVADIGNGPIVLINPKISEKSGEQTFTEGCLSLPGVEAPIVRAEQIVVNGLDKTGQKIKIEAEGLMATVFQHEIDHLDGYVFIDRVKDPSLIRHVAFKSEKREELI